MFCNNCGANIPSDNPKFCPKCGAALELGQTDDAQQEVASEAEAEAKPEADAAPAAAPKPEANAGSAPEPKAKPAPTATPKAKPNPKLIALVAAVVVVAIVAAVAVATSLNKPSDAPQDPQPPETQPEPDLTTEEKRAFFVGKWVAQDSTDKNMPKSWFVSAAKEGMYITLTLWDDGTGVFRTDTGPVKITWDADSVTAGKMTVDDAELSLTLRSKKLTTTNAEGTEMYFVPEDEVDMSNAVDLTNRGQGVTVDPGSIQVEQYLRLIGNESVGYMQVPESWTNRTDDLSADFKKSQAAIMYADPRSEYLSPSLEHAAFSQMVEMSRHSESYLDLADKLANSYKTDKNYANTTTKRMTVGKRRAIYVASENTADNVSVASVVIDRDNDEKVSVVLSLNCGAIGDDKIAEQLAAFLETGRVEWISERAS